MSRLYMWVGHNALTIFIGCSVSIFFSFLLFLSSLYVFPRSLFVFVTRARTICWSLQFTVNPRFIVPTLSLKSIIFSPVIGSHIRRTWNLWNFRLRQIYIRSAVAVHRKFTFCTLYFTVDSFFIPLLHYVSRHL